jgi:LAO/AO transport system kinase
MAIQMILGFRKADGWKPVVLKAVASEGTGIDRIAATIAEHRSYMEQSGMLVSKRSYRMECRIRELVANRLGVDFWTHEREDLLKVRVRDVMALKSTPYDIANELLNDVREMQ